MRRKIPRSRNAFDRTIIALAVASFFCSGLALANPTGPTVVNGTAAIVQNGNQLQITNSPNAIINWQSFSIGANEITRFIQQSQSSAVLNRVTGSAGVINPSVILGALQSNGRVFLINPSGILFGAGAQIDVAGLVATSLNLSNADFLAGRFNFTEMPGAGSVVNEGNITTGSGGPVYLVGPAVTNSGIITSPKGEVILAAGNSVELVNPGTPNLRVLITAPDNQAVNLGTIVADAGRIGIYAGLVRQSGTVRANTVVRGENGEILLKATKDVELTAGSVTTASGPSAGKVTIEAGSGSAKIAGTIEANAVTNSPPAGGGVAQSAGVAGERGGTIDIRAQRDITVDAQAVITANGASGGWVTVQSIAGTTLVSGRVEAKGFGSPPTGGGVAGVADTGGAIHVLGEYVGLIDAAQLDASGTMGGGTVLIGGDYQGSNPLVQNALQTYIGPDAKINVDAIFSGNGGRAIVWADKATDFRGFITARGGSQDGNGGFVEVSGKGFLRYLGSADLRAPKGKAGLLFLDPTDINIVATGTATPDTLLTGQLFEDTAAIATSEITITALAAALGNGDVTISTSNSNGTSANGDITWTGAFNYNGIGTKTLTLNANRNIVFSAGAIITDGTPGGDVLNLVLNPGGGGVITIAGTINNGGGTTALNGATTLSGTLAGGTLTSTAILTSSGGILDGMTIGSNLSHSGTLNIQNSLLLANGVDFNKGANTWNFQTTGTQNIAMVGGTGAATITSSGGSIVAGAGVAGQTLVIGAGVTLQTAGTGTSNLSQSQVTPIINNGTILSATGGTWTITPSTFTNNGSVEVSSGTINVNSASWSNSGTGVFDVSGGILNLGGSFSNANVGAVARSGGSINVTGTFNLGGATLDIGSTGLFGTGGLTQLSGTLSGGTLTSDGVVALASSNGILSGMTIGSNLSHSGTLNIQNSLLLANGVDFNKGANTWNFQTTGTQNIAMVGGTGAATITSSGGSIVAGAGVAGQTLVIGAGVTLQTAGTGTSNLSQSQVTPIINNGTILSATGGTWTITPSTFTNNGSVEVSSGTINVNSASWSNSGTGVFDVSGGILNLGGSFSNANVGAVARSGGSINVTGTFNLGGATLDIGSTGLFGTGGLTQLSGTLSGGTLTSDGVVALASSNGILSGMTIGSNLSHSGTLNIQNSLLLANGVDFNKGANTWNFQTTGTQNIAMVGGTGAATITSSGGSIVAGAGVAGQTLVIGAGVTLQTAGTGTSNLSQSQVTPIINNGTILSATGGTWTITPSTFTNNGSVEVSSGTINVNSASWSNSGTGVFDVSGGILNLGGSFSNANVGAVARSGGSINVTGTFNLGGATLDIGSTGLFGTGGLTQLSGTLSGGTLTSDGVVALASSNGILSGMTIGSNLSHSGTLNIQNSLLLANGVDFNKGANTWNFQTTGTQNIAMVGGTGAATITSSGGSIVAGAGVAGQTLVIGAGVTLQTAGTGTSNLSQSQVTPIINNGTILSATGGTWTITPSTFTNNGSVEVSSGTINVNSASWSNSGTGVFDVSGGILNLGGSFSNANVGAVARSGGSINVTGTFNLGGATLDIGSTGLFGTGGLTQLSGTLSGGTLTSDGVVALASSNGILSGMTIGSNLSHSGTLNIQNSLLLANGVDFNKGANTWNFQTTGTQNIAMVGGTGAATITSSGGSIVAGAGVAGQTLVIGAGVTLQTAGTGTSNLSQSQVTPIINNGTILSATGGTWTITPSTFTNNGSVEVSSGTINVNSASWSNSGTGVFDVSGGILNLGGSFSNANVGAVARSGGSINVTGTFNLGGATLDIGSTGLFGTGGLTQLSGTLSGGTLTSDGVVALASSNGILSGMTIGSNLSHSGTLNIQNSLLLANGVDFNKGANTWNFQTTGTQNIAMVGGTGAATITSSGGSIVAGAGVAGQTLVIGAGVTLQTAGTGTSNLSQSQVTPIINNGTILSATGGTWTITPSTFTNNGSVEVSSGTINVNSASWSNSGTGVFDVSGGILNLGGSFSNANVGAVARSGGSINVTGTFNLGGATLDIGSTGLFGTGGLTQLSGTLSGGTLTSDGVVALASSNGILSGMTIGSNLSHSGTLNIQNSLLLANGVDFNKGANTWNFQTTGTQNIAMVGGTGAATITSSGGSIVAGAGVAGQTLVIGAGVTLQTAGTGTSNLSQSQVTPIINNGTILSATGGTWTITPSTFTNNGTMSVTAGTLTTGAGFTSNAGTILVSAGSTWSATGNPSISNTGIIRSAGTINLGTGTLINASGGILRPGASPGLTSITGNLTLDNGSITEIEISGLGRGVDPGYDAFNVSGTATVNSGAQFTILHLGFTPTVGNSFQVISAGTLSVPGGAGSVGINFPTGEDYVAGVSGQSFVLQRGTTFSPVNFWLNDVSSNWATGSNWSLGVPVAGQIVIIDRGAANPTVTVNSAGQVALQLQSLEALTISAGSLDLSGPSTISGTLTISGGTLSGTGNITVNGLFIWDTTAGLSFLTGTGTFTTTGTSTLSGAGVNSHRLESRVWNNTGTASLTGGHLSLNNGATFNNSNTFNVSTSSTIGIDSNGGGTNTFNNTGTINWNTPGAAGISVITAFNNTGTVNVNGGTINIAVGGTDTNGVYTVTSPGVLQFSAGTRTLSGASNVSGTGAFNFTGGTVNIDGGGFAPGGTTTISGGTLNVNVAVSAGALSFSSGTVGGTGGLTVSGPFAWSGGTLSGTGLLTTSGPSTIAGSGGTLSKNWTNNSAVDLQGTTQLNVAAGHTFTNAIGAIFNVSSTDANALGGAGAFDNQGTLNKNNTAAQTYSTALTNSGTVNVNGNKLTISSSGADSGTYDVGAGTTLHFSSGTRNLNAGSDITGNGELAVDGGTLNVRGNFGIAGTGTVSVGGGTLDIDTVGAGVAFANTLTLNSGTLTGADNVTVSGPFNWGGGTISGSGNFTVDGVLTASGLVKTLDGRTLVHTNASGSSTLSGSADFDLNNGAVFRNAAGAVLNANAGGGGLSLRNAGAAAAFDNQGTFNSIGATLTIGTTGTVNISNTGIVNINSGTTNFADFPTNAGTLNIASGATLSTNGNNLTSTSTGIITGGGTLNLGGAPRALTNQGTLRAGTSPGTLTINGDLVLDGVNGSVTEIELGGLTPGTQYDVINVSGQVRGTGAGNANWGTLNVTHVGGFTASSGNSFQVMNYGSAIGDFTTKSFPAGFPYTGSAGATSYLVAYGGLDNIWIVDASGFWDDPANWSLGHVPGDTETAVVDRAAGTFTVTVRTPVVTPGPQTALNVRMEGDENLTIASDLLTLAGGTSLINGTLTVAGGTLTNNGALTANTLILTNGIVNGIGSLTVASSYSHTGGTISIGGAASITQSVGNLALGQITAGSITVSAPGNLSVNGALNAGTGNVTLDAGGTIGQVGAIAGEGLEIIAGGNVSLSSGANNVATLAASVTGAGSTLVYFDADNLTIGVVGGTSGITTTNGNAQVRAVNGDLTVSNNISFGAAQLLLESRKAGGVLTIGPGVAVAGNLALVYNADDLVIDPSSTTTMTGAGTLIQLFPNTGTRDISMGAGTAPGTMGVSQAELQTMTATTISLGCTPCTGTIATDGAVNLPGAAINFTSQGGNVILDHAFTAGSLGIHNDFNSPTSTGGTTSGSGQLTIPILSAFTNNGISFTNPANSITLFEAVNHLSGDIILQSGIATGIGVRVRNDAPGGSIFIVNNAGGIGTSGAGSIFGVTTTGAGASDITLQALGLVGINAGMPVSAGGTGVVSLTGTGITNNDTIAGPGGVVVNAGTGTFANATATSVVTNGAGAAPVTFSADDVSLAAGSQIVGGSGTVTLRPFTLSRDVAIESGSSAGVLNLTPAELRTIVSAGTLEIGRNDAGAAGNVAVTTAVAATDIMAGTLRLLAGNDVAFTTSDLRTNGNLAITANHDVTMHDSWVQANGTMDVLAVNNLNMTAVNAPTVMYSAGGAMQTVTANGIALKGADTGVQNQARILGTGGQNITAGGNGITLTAGSGGDRNNASFWQSGTTSNQTIVAGGITLTGGDGGTDNQAFIQNDGPLQSITITGGGELKLQGGSGAGGGMSAGIYAFGQTIAFANGGSIDITGGTVGTANWAEILADGNQTISGNPDIALTGGASGGASAGLGNSADISMAGLAGNVQSIAAHNLTLQGGAGGAGNAAVIATWGTGVTQSITATGVVSLIGGAGTDAIAAIGSPNLPWGLSLGDASTTLNSTGAVTLQSGAGAVGADGMGGMALIGALGGFNADVTINGQAGISLSKGGGASANAMIGSDTGGGTLVVRSGLGGSGDLALNDGIIKTIGTATLSAGGSGGITQSVAATSVTALSGLALAGASIGSAANPIVFDAGGIPVSASASTGGIYLNQPTGDLLTSQYVLSSAGAGQTISLATTDGSITIDSTTGFNANTADDSFSFTTAGPARDIAFAGGISLTAAGLNLAGTGNATFNAGTVTLNTPLASIMPVIVSGATVNFNTPFTFGGALALSGGAINSPATAPLTLTGTLDWSGGGFSGAGALNTAGVTNITGSAAVSDKTWNNSGTLTISGPGSLQLGVNSAFNNQPGGVLNLSGSSPVAIGSSGGPSVFTNDATINVSSAGTQTIGDAGLAFNNAGILNVNAGTLRIAGDGTDDGGAYNPAAGATLQFSGGTRNFGDGVLFTGAGATQFTGAAVNFTGAGAGATLAAGSTLSVNGLTLGGAGNFTNLGTFDFDASAFSGNLVNQGVMNVGAGTSTLSGAAFDLNGGTLNLTGTLVKNGGTFNWNAGTLSGTGTLTPAGGATVAMAGPGARVLNGPTLSTNNLNVGGGSLTVQSGTLNAAGTTTVVSGATLSVQGGSLNAAGGDVDISGLFEALGGTVTAGTMNVLAGGTLLGTGTVTADVNNTAGTVAPGASPGMLTVVGNYVQGSAGTLSIEVGGATPGVQHDVLDVTGNTTLDGILVVTLVNGFMPVLNETFTVIQSGGTVSGTFAATSFPLLTTFTPSYFLASLALVAGASRLPSAIVASTQVLIAATDQSAIFQAEAMAPSGGVEDKKQEEERLEMQKKQSCTGGSSGGGGGGGGGGGAAAGGGGSRCTTRGCF